MALHILGSNRRGSVCAMLPGAVWVSHFLYWPHALLLFWFIEPQCVCGGGGGGG